MVAVNRNKYYFGRKIPVPLREMQAESKLSNNKK
jgi:hypothetical protein